MGNPLKRIFAIRRDELPTALLMASYFFLVITSFWVLKPIKKSLFIGYYHPAAQDGLTLAGRHIGGPTAELYAKLLNMLVAAIAMVVFTWLARRFVRQQLTTIFAAFFAACYLAYIPLLPTDLSVPGQHLVIWSFYLFGDLFSTVMVVTFFAFLNDSVDSDGAKRLYGVVGFGGVVGGSFASIVRATVGSDMSNTGWLVTLAVVAGVIAALAQAAGRIGDRARAAPTAEAEPAEDTAKPTGNPAIEGARLVFSSRYLLAIVGIVGMYEIVSTIMDFQFTATLVHYTADGDAFGRHLDIVYAFTLNAAMVIQLFLTSAIMRRFNIGGALLVLPAAALAASLAFLAAPILWIGSALNPADNAFSYSINQSAREALYVPTSRDEKYKAKAFIDMLLQRIAKGVAVAISIGVTTVFTDFGGVRWLSLVTAAILVGWIATVRYAGRRFEELTRDETT
ncbi:hypothetical protein CMK11_04175 [Candidatus Poribacteria bacterium]|nr:hypothetical protein [Candidatus Poribacteria bacterium]